MKTFVFASDLHGDHQHPDAVEALLKFCSIFSPDVRIFGGDLFDFRAIRRAATEAEKNDSMAADVEAGLAFLRDYKPHVFLRGNHDERIWDVARTTQHGLIRDAAEQGIKDIEKACRKNKTRMLPYDSRSGVYRLGKLSFIHGYHSGVYATKKHAEVYAEPGGCVLHGHTHSIQSASIVRYGGAHGRGVGCLTYLDPDYNRHQTAKLGHENGFAYGVVDGKHWQCYQARPTENGKWHVAKELTTL